MAAAGIRTRPAGYYQQRHGPACARVGVPSRVGPARVLTKPGQFRNALGWSEIPDNRKPVLVGFKKGAFLPPAVAGQYLKYSEYYTASTNIKFLWGAPWRRRRRLNFLRQVAHICHCAPYQLFSQVFVVPAALQSEPHSHEGTIA